MYVYEIDESLCLLLGKRLMKEYRICRKYYLFSEL